MSLELAIGASIGGQRSLVATKSVGFNVMLDPIMTLNLTGCNAGMVILLGDDPGAYGSQNDQDTRLLAHAAKLPMLEPASATEMYGMVQAAYKLSEKFRTPVIIRETRAAAQSTSDIDVPDLTLDQLQAVGQCADANSDDSASLCPDTNTPFRYCPYPQNAVSMSAAMHDRLHRWEEALSSSSSSNPLQQVNLRFGTGDIGILCGG